MRISAQIASCIAVVVAVVVSALAACGPTTMYDKARDPSVSSAEILRSVRANPQATRANDALLGLLQRGQCDPATIRELVSLGATPQASRRRVVRQFGRYTPQRTTQIRVREAEPAFWIALRTCPSLEGARTLLELEPNAASPQLFSSGNFLLKWPKKVWYYETQKVKAAAAKKWLFFALKRFADSPEHQAQESYRRAVFGAYAVASYVDSSEYSSSRVSEIYSSMQDYFYYCRQVPSARARCLSPLGQTLVAEVLAAYLAGVSQHYIDKEVSSMFVAALALGDPAMAEPFMNHRIKFVDARGMGDANRWAWLPVPDEFAGLNPGDVAELQANQATSAEAAGLWRSLGQRIEATGIEVSRGEALLAKQQRGRKSLSNSRQSVRNAEAKMAQQMRALEEADMARGRQIRKCNQEYGWDIRTCQENPYYEEDRQLRIERHVEEKMKQGWRPNQGSSQSNANDDDDDESSDSNPTTTTSDADGPGTQDANAPKNDTDQQKAVTDVANCQGSCPTVLGKCGAPRPVAPLNIPPEPPKTVESTYSVGSVDAYNSTWFASEDAAMDLVRTKIRNNADSACTATQGRVSSVGNGYVNCEQNGNGRFKCSEEQARVTCIRKDPNPAHEAWKQQRDAARRDHQNEEREARQHESCVRQAERERSSCERQCSQKR